MVYAILDTNTLLLLIVGTTDINYISAHKRTNQFTKENYQTLMDFLPSNLTIIYPPHVAAEVSNLIDFSSNQKMKSDIFHTFSTFIRQQNETSVTSFDALNRQEFINLGLTDAALLLLSEMQHQGKKAHLITADLELAIAAEMAGYDVTNFNHLIDV